MELIAKNGYWLTQANLQNEDERMFWRRLTPARSLGRADFERWTDAQKKEWEAAHPVQEPEEVQP